MLCVARAAYYTTRVQSLLVVGLCLAAGLGLRWVPSFPAATAAAVLNAFVLYVPLPALILVQVPRLAQVGVGADVLAPLLVPWILLVFSVVVVLAAARAFGWSRPTTAALLLLVPLGNTSFLGIPLTSAWLGPDAVPYAVLYDQLGSFLALTIYGALIIARYSGAADEPLPQMGRLAKKVVLFPPFIALVVAVVLALTLRDGLSPLVSGALEQIAASLVPTVMVAVGLQWRLALPRHHLPVIALALGLKLVALPLFAWAFVQVAGLAGPAGDVAVFEAAMGPMITAGALAIAAGLEPELVAAIVGYGTLFSLGTSAVVWATLVPT